MFNMDKMTEYRDEDEQCLESQSASVPKRKWRKTNRKVLYDWKDPSIVSRLIALVEKRHALWDNASPEYKLPKLNTWQEIAAELGNGIDWNDAKVKWMNLRVTFRSNLVKIRAKAKASRGAHESHNVVWRHFKEMMFLETAEVEHTCEPTSSLVLPNATAKRSILRESPPTAAPSRVGQRRQRERSRPPPTLTPSPTPSHTSASMKELAVQVLSNCQARQRRDHHSLFGEYLASESRILSPDASDELRERLFRTLFEFKMELRLRAASQAVPLNESTPSMDLPLNMPEMIVDLEDQETKHFDVKPYNNHQTE